MDLLHLKAKLIGRPYRGPEDGGSDAGRAAREGGNFGGTGSYGSGSAAGGSGGDPSGRGGGNGGGSATMADPNQGPQPPTMGDPNAGPPEPSSWQSGGWSSGSAFSGPITGEAWNNAPAPVDATRSMVAGQPATVDSAVATDNSPTKRMLDQAKKDAVGNLVDRYGNPVYSGDTARAIQSGGLIAGPTGALQAFSKDNTKAVNGQSFDSIREGIANGTIDPNGMISQSQTYAQALGVKDYAEPVMKGIANVAMMAVPAPLKIAASALANYDKTGSASQAITGGIKDYVSSLAMGKLNSAIGKALGPEIGGALSTVNQAGSLVNAVTGEKAAPTFNPAGLIASKLGIGSSSMPAIGSSMPDGGTPIPTGGWSSGGGGGSAQAPQQQAPQAAVAQPVSTAPTDGLIGDVAKWFRDGRGTLKKGY